MIPQAERFLLLFFVFKIQVSVAEKIFVAAFAKIVCAVNLTLTCFVQGFRTIISTVGADSINIRQSVFTTNTVRGLVSLLTLGLDPNFDSIY